MDKYLSQKNWRENNHDKVLAYQKKWREKNPSYYHNYYIGNWVKTPKEIISKKISVSNSGHPVSIETRNKISKSNLGKIGLKGKDHPNWKDGKQKHNSGYIMAWIGANKYIPEHRLLMEKHLGRKLEKWELIHHKNKIRNDNRIENLEIVTRAEHMTLEKRYLKTKCPYCNKSFLIK